MMLNKRERNRIYEVITKNEFDPAEFDLDDDGDKVSITHNSGSVFEVSFKAGEAAFLEEFGIDNSRFEYKFSVTEGNSKTGGTSSIELVTRLYMPDWLKEIHLTVEMPNY
jgi:hypothetical protein